MSDNMPGSDIANKMGWNEHTMLELFSRFICEHGHEGQWVNFLNDLAKAEEAACESEEP